MVLQVPSDFRRIEPHGQAEPGQLLRRANSAELQQLRRLDRARSQNDFPLCPHRFCLPIFPISHSDGPVAFKLYAKDGRF